MTLIVGFLLIVVTVVSGSGIIYLTSSAGSSVVLSVTPAIANTSIGGSFAVAVNVSNVRDLGKWEMRISWNASVIDLEESSGGAVAEGPFLRSANAPTKFQFDPYTSGSGVLSGVSCSILQAKGASGTGSVLQLRFKAIGEGATSITINDAKLYDYMGRIMIPPPSIVSGKVNVNSASVVHDVKIAAFDCPTSAVAGQSALLNVTVENLGISDENGIQVRLDVNGSLCKSIITSVPANSHNQTCFNWTASPVGTLSLTVSLVLVSEDMNLTNNVAWKLINVVSLPSHDLEISLSSTLPDHVTLGEKVWVNATIVNLGSVPDNSFASICLDNESVKTESIYELAAGSSCEIWYPWIPSGTGVFNIAALVTCVPSETNMSNNQDTRNVTVVPSTGNGGILIVSGDNGQLYNRGTSLQEFENAISVSHRYEIWQESLMGHPTLETLLNYQLVIWTCGDFSMNAIGWVDAKTLKNYTLQGGNVIIEGENVAFDANAEFRTDVLHLRYLGYYGGSIMPYGAYMTDSQQWFARELGNFSWKAQPNHLDRFMPSNGAYDIMRFWGPLYGSYFDTTAVNVFDGTQTGTGSVIYYDFGIFSLPTPERNLLVQSSVSWLLRLGVSVVGSKLVNAPSNSAYFIYTDPSFLSVNEAFSMASGAALYGLCKNPQYQGFNTTQNWLASGKINSSEIHDSLIVLFGNPTYDATVEYYEDAGLTPVKYYENSTHFMFLDRNGSIILSLLRTDVNGGLADAFVVYGFADGNNLFLVSYGFGWKGTWAASKFFSDKISKDFPKYFEPFYVFTMEDIHK
jgi:hypothetical protein